MPCYSPLTAYQTRSGEIVFNELKRHGDCKQLTLPCRQCIGCRLERSRQWAMRCVHEASLHTANSFITLTYEDAKLPPHNSLRHRDYQLFMKRLRKHTGPSRVRFYMCGEYGTETHRPHYHALLFGWDWPDKTYWSQNQNGDKLYKSELLSKLWGHGHTLTGDVTFESAAYTARYCLQKRTGKQAKDYYGERTPDYNKMSLRTAIGKEWYEKYKGDVHTHDIVVIRGKETKPPAYYDKLLKRTDPELHQIIHEKREWDAYLNRDDNTPERLRAKEIVATAKTQLLVRTEI